MAYGSVSGVRALTGVEETAEWDDRITGWLADSDAEIEKRLGQFPVPVPVMIVRLSNLITALTVLDRMKAEGSVSDIRIGEVSDNPLQAVEAAVKDYQAEAKEIFRLYRTPNVKSSSYEHINEED